MLPWFFFPFLLSSHFPQIAQGTPPTKLVLWDSRWKMALLPDQQDPKHWAKAEDLTDGLQPQPDSSLVLGYSGSGAAALE